MNAVRNIAIMMIVACLGWTSARPQVTSPQVQELTGTVSCNRCFSQHTSFHKGQTNFSCTLMCVGQGADYVLIVGDKRYVLQGNKSQLEKFAGGRAAVSGEVHGNILEVKSLLPSH